MKKRNVIITLLFLLMMSTHSTAQVFSFDEVAYSPKKTVFRLFAPQDAKSVRVEYSADALAPGQATWKAAPMSMGKDGIWTATVKQDLGHQAYRFVVDGRVSPGVFAKAVSVNGRYGYILDLSETDPDGWTDDQRPALSSPADLVIYELHHRDFSIDPSSGIVNKGKFLALTEPNAIAHLKALGVNAVHILPSYDFGSIDETRLDLGRYNWGYDPVNYNVPEGSYSTDPYDPASRIREFKMMVQALHRAGIRVILDVVYNHTYDIEHSNFQLTYPDYYYRGERSEGSGAMVYSNGSGCGNETASEQPMMRQFMIESVKHWINEYHIDGFRFDLMGVHDIETMNAIRTAVDAIDPTIFLYGEGWSAGQCAYPQEKLAAKAHVPMMPRIAAFSDEIRDALRGPFSDDTKGAFLIGIPGSEESLKFGIAGAIDHPQIDFTKVNYSQAPWAQQPTQMISYVSCHDDMCLVDRLKTSLFHHYASDSIKLTYDHITKWVEGQVVALDMLAQTAVFTSQGVPFILCGEEMLRDKKGVHNSYKSSDKINHLDWDNLTRYPQLYDYYKNLTALRRHHPAFRLGDAALVRQHLEFLPTQDCLVAFRLKDHAGGDSWKNIIVVLNGSREVKTVAIDEGQYTVVCRDGVIDENGLGVLSGNTLTVSPQSALIIHD